MSLLRYWAEVANLHVARFSPFSAARVTARDSITTWRAAFNQQITHRLEGGCGPAEAINRLCRGIIRGPGDNHRFCSERLVHRNEYYKAFELFRRMTEPLVQIRANGLTANQSPGRRHGEQCADDSFTSVR